MRLPSAAQGWPGRRRRRTIAGTGPVAIDSLVFPYRADVLIRAEHFDFAATHRDLFLSDFPGYESSARRTPYFLWWTQIAMPRYGRGRDVDAAFRSRLIRSQELRLAFSDDFLAAHPIHLRTAAPGARTETGLPASAAFFLGDGGHRLALLMHAGRTALRPDHYRVRTDPRTSIIDNTSILAALLPPSAVTLAVSLPAHRTSVGSLSRS